MEQSLGAVPAIAAAMFYTILLKSILKAGRLFFCLSLLSFLFFPLLSSFPLDCHGGQSLLGFSLKFSDLYGR